MFGLARTGASAIRSLVAGGARVFAWDDGERSRAIAPIWAREISAFCVVAVGSDSHIGLEPRCAADASRAARSGQRRAPSRRRNHRRHGVVCPRVAREPGSGRAPVIAVTGTNGKSTTTALIGHILAACGFLPRSAAISASRCSNSGRRPRDRPMCWKCHRIRSSCRQALRRTLLS